MIITQTPLRISFLGGGTDYPEYYSRHGGETLAVSIDKYVTVSVHPLTQFVDYRVRVHYSHLETAKQIDDIKHTTARESMRHMGLDGGVEIYYSDDLPARTGLGSSSAATVGLLNALHALKGESVTREHLADEAIHVEREMVKDRIGSQDQYMCALGGFRHLQFLPDGRVIAHPITMTRARAAALQERLLLLYTGKQRNAHDVLKEQSERTRSGENDASLLKLKQLVGEGVNIVKGTSDLKEFGALLHEGFEIKRTLSNQVSDRWIDELYDRARLAGAIGGKLLGAGGGGFLLLFVEPDKRRSVREALQDLPEAVFAFEGGGSRIIFQSTHRP